MDSENVEEQSKRKDTWAGGATSSGEESSGLRIPRAPACARLCPDAEASLGGRGGSSLQPTPSLRPAQQVQRDVSAEGIHFLPPVLRLPVASDNTTWDSGWDRLTHRALQVFWISSPGSFLGAS